MKNPRKRPILSQKEKDTLIENLFLDDILELVGERYMEERDNNLSQEKQKNKKIIL